MDFQFVSGHPEEQWFLTGVPRNNESRILFLLLSWLSTIKI